MMKKLTLLLIVQLLLYVPVHAIDKEAFNYYFSRISGEDGLSQSNVKCILQDSYGFMWFGTKNGLNRYDGTNILTIDVDDYRKGKGNHNISALFEDTNRYLWIGTDEGVYIYNPVNESFTFIDQTTDSGIEMSNWVSDIRSDHDGNIWIVIPNQGVFRYRNQKLYHYYITDPQKYASENPQCICVRENGEVWIGTSYQGLYLYNEFSDRFKQYIEDKNGNSLRGENIYSICDYGRYIAIAIHEGELKKYQVEDNELTLVNAPQVHHTVLREVTCFNQDELWVGTQAGLFIIHEKSNKTIHIREDAIHPYGLSDNAIYVIYKDNQQGVWLGTNFGGANYLANRKIPFEKYVPLNTSGSLSSKRIREMVEDPEGNIWIGTEDEGINLLNPRTGMITQVGRPQSTRNNWLHTLSLFLHENEIWCGLFKRGITTIRLSDHTFRHYDKNDLQLDEASVYTLCHDREGRIWLGNGWGISVCEPGGRTFRKVEEVKPCWIFDIMEDSEGLIWFASMGTGVYMYNPETGQYTHYTHIPGDPATLSSNSVSNIMQDRRGNIWFSTDRGGICRFRKDTGQFTTFSIRDGLPDDVAYTILEDDEDNLWFGTNRGLVKYNPDTNKIRVFTTSDGLLGNQFNYKSALKASNGKFYFGGIDGLIAFYPYDEVLDDFIPPVYITKVSVYNQELTVHSPGSPLEKSILFTDKVILPYYQSNISLDFVALDYASPQSNHFIYKMDPVDKGWTPSSRNHTVSYSKLPPGNYTFRVMVRNNDSVWKENETSIQITILPPWWQTTMAYASYIILFICILCSGLYWYKKRKDKKMEEAKRLYEIEKEKELYSAKVEFFTEIAHEVKTPLTLINGPLETIMEMSIPDDKIRKNLEVISLNTNRLLELTKQLLDFRKVGANKFLMDFVMTDINTLVRDILTRFQPTYDKQHKQVTIRLPEESFSAAIDKEGFTKIVSNLLNNGLKYTRQTVHIELMKEQTTFTLRVDSDGKKIPREQSQRIFEPFYQMEQNDKGVSGAGIGLALSRSLAELHNGRLYLDTEASLNSFVLILPLNQEKVIHLKDHSVKDEYIRIDEDNPEDKKTEYTLLLVEDNETMKSFIGNKLSTLFQVHTASNGIEALEILTRQHIDLIISDIMMPGMDGMELCTTIKSNVDYSHIPFIFLTAKDDLDSKINGLRAGAEAYVEKPFSFNHLTTQVLSLLENRRKEREAFSKRPFFPIHNMNMNKADEEFMNRIIQIIRENITDENFNVEKLADFSYMSRSNLFRKIKTLSDLSPVEFIKLIRLKKAAELIAEGKYRIGEICFMVGINSPSYFSKLFQKQFGISPKDFEKENRMKQDN